MKIALVGYGKMGKEIAKICQKRKHTVVAIIDPTDPGATHKSINADSLKDADVVIEFTSPSAAVKNIEVIAALKKNMVVGTTGWHDQLPYVQKTIAKNDVGMIHGTNFSIGVNLFFRIVEGAAKLVNKVEDYDVFGFEMHHRKKADAPSGTAKTLSDILLKNISRKKKVAFHSPDKVLHDDAIHIASIRAGNLPGTHVIGFDSPQDSVELRHDAKGREGFALGAVLAAEWIAGKKGTYTVSDFFDGYFK